MPLGAERVVKGLKVRRQVGGAGGRDFVDSRSEYFAVPSASSVARTRRVQRRAEGHNSGRDEACQHERRTELTQPTHKSSSNRNADSGGLFAGRSENCPANGVTLKST